MISPICQIEGLPIIFRFPQSTAHVCDLIGSGSSGAVQVAAALGAQVADFSDAESLRHVWGLMKEMIGSSLCSLQARD
jgi:hypothetical protein